MKRSDPASLIDRLLALGSTAAEVYSKDGRSIRLSRDREGNSSEAEVRESGIALRAWGVSGQEGFASSVLDVSLGLERALRRIGTSLNDTTASIGDGPPDLPSEAAGAGPGTRPAGIDDEVDLLAAMGRDALAALAGEFGRPGREALGLEGAWWEAGASEARLINSSGFDGTRGVKGWQLIVALRAGVGKDARLCLFGWRGDGGKEPETSRLAEEAAWRAAAPIGGGRPTHVGSSPAVIDSLLASQVLQALSPWFVASEAGAQALSIGERLGPPGLEITEMQEPMGAMGATASWDDEGVPSSAVKLVSGGRLVGLLTDLSSSRALGLPRTGSARRASFRDRPEARPGRLILSFQGGEAKDPGLLGRLAPGLFMTTGRIVLPEGGLGGAILGGGVRVDSGRAIGPVGRVFLQGGPRALLRSLEAVAGQSAAGLPIGHPAPGSWLVGGDLFPA